MTHAVVLAIALAMSGYSAIDRSFFPISHAPAVTAAAADQGLTVGERSQRDGVIIKPLAIPTSALPSRAPIVHIVVLGDTLESIGKEFNLPWRDVLWSNPGLRMPLAVGRPIKLPPVPGAVVVVKKNDTPAFLANRYGVEVSTLLGFNGIHGGQLTTGAVLVIPVDPTQGGPNLSTGVPADPLDSGQFLCPIAGAPIIQQFGPTSFELEPSFGGYLHFHTGVDLLAGYNTPIVAAAGGRVTAVGPADYFGIRVEVTDSFGLVEIYAHMSQAAVAIGQEVQQGERVGYVGSTGLSIGAHLHFQLEVGGLPTAPGALIGC